MLLFQIEAFELTNGRDKESKFVRVKFEESKKQREFEVRCRSSSRGCVEDPDQKVSRTSKSYTHRFQFLLHFPNSFLLIRNIPSMNCSLDI